VRRLLIWHQGGLGDLLLTAPALRAICEGYPDAGLVAVGHPGRWGELFSWTFPLTAVWDGGEALWSGLYREAGPLSPKLLERLTGIEAAFVFTPKPGPVFLRRLREGGIPSVVWAPSFPVQGTDHVTVAQARRLAEVGLRVSSEPFRLHFPEAVRGEEEKTLGTAPILAVAPGSGSPAKNWPLSRYYEAARALAWEASLQVVWLAGPAEGPVLPYLEGLAAAQEQVVWAGKPLRQVAALLSRVHLYLGGDSGLTHLAAASGARSLLVLFGPTDPRVWAPLGENVTVVTPPGSSPGKASLADLPYEKVLAAARRLLSY